ncbi:unnamed protein product [Heterobilharzia americana]|nr:unnamed protein product [Heterobilharzia americana]
MFRVIRPNYGCVSFLNQCENVSRQPVRKFLPSTYASVGLWDTRLSHDIFKTIIPPRDHGLKLIHKLNSGRSVSPLDYDTFANKIHELDVTFLDFIEGIMKSFMNTQSAITVKDSTSHAFIRAYLGFQEEDRMLKLVEKRFETGIFVDFVSAVLMMNSFLKKGKWNSAVAVAWELCLQEYFTLEDFKPLVFAASLLSCLKSIEADSYLESLTPEVVDDKNVEYKFVSYVRNPNYDNFFDIKRPRLKTGYTLLHLSSALNKRRSIFQATIVWNNLSKCVDNLSLMTRVFGLALSEQCHQLSVELEGIKGPIIQSAGIIPAVVEKLMKIVDTCERRPDDLPLKRGEPQLPTVSEVQSVQNELRRIESESHATVSNVFTTAEDFIYNGVLNNSDCMNQETEAVKNLYAKFNEEREKEYTECTKQETREEIMKSAKEKLREILDEEERITYFTNLTKINRSAWLAPRTRRESQWSRMKEWRQEVSSFKQQQENNEPQ